MPNRDEQIMFNRWVEMGLAQLPEPFEPAEPVAPVQNIPPDFHPLAGQRPPAIPDEVWAQHIRQMERFHGKVNEPEEPEDGAEAIKVNNKLQRENPDYQSLEDIRMRLDKSMILIGDEPVYIYKIGSYRGDYRVYTVAGPDAPSKFFYYNQEKANLDLRGPPVGYCYYRNKTYNLRRIPERVQKQGMNSENSSLCRVGNNGIDRFRDGPEFVQVLRSRKTRHWSRGLADVFQDKLLTDAPLSNRIAVYTTPENKLAVEYKGRYLGPLEGRKVRLTQEDSDKSWIAHDLETVSLEASRA